MYVAAHETKFSILSRYAMQLETTKEERVHLLAKGLHFELCALSIHMTFGGKKLQ